MIQRIPDGKKPGPARVFMGNRSVGRLDLAGRFSRSELVIGAILIQIPHKINRLKLSK